ncbi:MAG: hypothetical protein AB1451_01680 [Nitrospirota bacterium]
MRIRIVLALVLALAVCGCATMRDTIEGRESGTSRILEVPFDSTWAAAVEVMRPYQTAEIDKTHGVLVTDWVERLVEPDAFAQQGILKERTRFEIAIAARDGGSRVAVRRTVELLAPVFVHPAAASPKPVCEDPFCGPENPWERPQGSPVYVWQNIAQVQNAPESSSSQRELEILDAIEAAAKGMSEQGNASGAAGTK